MTLNSITKGLIAAVMLLVTTVAIAETVLSQKSNVERKNRSGNDLVYYLMEQLYDMKPKIETMKTKIEDLEFYIGAQKKQIETLQNRESGIVGQHKFPAPKWPYIQSVKFTSNFEERPTVTYGLFILDSDHKKNLRLSTAVTDITKIGFQIKLNTWGDPGLFGANIRWMACGK